MVKIDNSQRIPLYKQIIRAIKNKIKNGEYREGEKLPSINKLQRELSVSRNTIIKAYDKLISRGIIRSISGKGYYVFKDSYQIEHNIFLLFDLFLPYKEKLYSSFMDNIGENATVDIYFHHYDKELYKKIIRGALGQYTDYVIMPLDSDQDLMNWFDNIFEDEKVYILDLGINEYGRRYPSVCQNFRKEWYECLTEVENQIKQYDRIILKHRALYSKSKQPHDKEMIAGFSEFCRDKNIKYKIVDKKGELEVNKNECYFVTDDDDLVKTIKNAIAKNYKLGEDMGIISHNETPLKSIACLHGVTTITTDFNEMGRNMAEMIKHNKNEHIENPSKLILRDSI